MTETTNAAALTGTVLLRLRALEVELQKARIELEEYKAVLKEYADQENWAYDDNNSVFEDVWVEVENGYESAQAVLEKYA